MPTETKSQFGCSTSGVSTDFPLTIQIITVVSLDHFIYRSSFKRFFKNLLELISQHPESFKNACVSISNLSLRFKSDVVSLFTVGGLSIFRQHCWVLRLMETDPGSFCHYCAEQLPTAHLLVKILPQKLSVILMWTPRASVAGKQNALSPWPNVTHQNTRRKLFM